MERGIDIYSSVPVNRRTFSKGAFASLAILGAAGIARPIEAVSLQPPPVVFSHRDNLPTFHFQQAYNDHEGEWFHAATSSGEPWSPYTRWRIFRKENTHMFDNNNVGEFFVQTQERVSNFSIMVGTDSQHFGELPGDSRWGLWFKTMEGAKLQVQDSDFETIRRHGERAEVLADNNGRVGLLLPEFDSEFVFNLSFSRPINQKDHRIRFGERRSLDFPPTIDAAKFV